MLSVMFLKAETVFQLKLDLSTGSEALDNNALMTFFTGIKIRLQIYKNSYSQVLNE